VSTPSFEERRLSFGDAASEYDDYRPGYPREAIEWIARAATRPIHEVADVGAGTGALSRLLVGEGYDVTAIDPDAKMLDQLKVGLKGVDCVVGRAEMLPLPTHSVDAVTVAQAFHWFDGARAAAEFRRVLRPGGVVGLIWNRRDDRVPWMSGLRPLVDDPNADISSVDEALAEIAEYFPDVVRAEFSHSVPMTPEAYVGLVGTFSFVRLHSDAANILDSVRQYLATHDDTRNRNYIDVPYVTAAYRAVGTPVT
jgi:SAM-dependent methyltransferase